MMKLLIVDDEPNVREGLKKIIDWDYFGFSLCGEASNGEDGLQKMIDLKPDLTLLDIKMPHMSGLELAAQARAMNHKGKIILLSGYSDFEFAQRAISYGVESYLLKPIDENELVKIVEETIKKIEAESELTLITDDFHKRFVQDALYEFVFLGDQVYSKYLPDRMKNSNSQMQFHIALFTMQDQKINFSIQNLIADYFSEFGYMTFQADDDYAILAIDYDRDGFIKHLSDFIHADMTGKLLVCAELCIGQEWGEYRTDEHPDKMYPQNLKTAYTRSKETMSRILFYGRNTVSGNRIIISRSVQSEIDESFYNICVEKMNRMLESMNDEGAKVTLDQFISAVEQNNIPVEKAKRISAEFVTEMQRKALLLYNENGMKIATDSYILDCIYEMKYFDDIAIFMKNKTDEILDEIGKFAKRDVFSRILFYIDRNYSENIKLDILASTFGYNSAYLGKLFKNRTGENFNQFLEKLRIEKAKKLLEETDEKVYMIARKSGFKNVDYFHLKFQKYVNESPSKYRKRENHRKREQ